MGRRHKPNPPSNPKKKQSQVNEPTLPADPPEQILEEALAYQELSLKMRDRLSKEADEGYLLSTKWLSSWKEYSGYDALVKGDDPQKCKGFGKKRPGKLNTDLLDKKAQRDFFELPQVLVEYSYLSQILDKDAQRDKEFIVVDYQVFALFHDKYQGVCIRRPLRRKKAGMPFVDVHLHSFYVVTLSRADANQIREASESVIKKSYEDLVDIKKLQVSSLWDLVRFKEYMGQYIAGKYELETPPKQLTAWRFEYFLSLKQIKMQLIEAIRANDGLITARQLIREQENEYDLDDFIKENTVIFVDYKPSGSGVEFVADELPEHIQGFCEECIEKKALNLRCFCNKVFYCSLKCQYDDKLFHYRTCNRAYESDDDEEYEKQVVKQQEAVCGLENLGNTCYMNATLQCLANIKGLTQYFLSNEYLQHIDKKELDDNGGIFIKKFAKFIKRLHKEQKMEPWSVKMQISYFIASFRGYEQHDANDLITYILNTLNDFVEKTEQENFAPFIANTFLGEFNSYVNCPECNVCSTTKDPFLEVSLPVKSKSALKDQPYVIVHGWNKMTRGTYQVKPTWKQVLTDLKLVPGKFQDVEIYVGSEGCDIKLVTEDSPEVINKRSKKDIVVFYTKKTGQKQLTQQIPVYFSFIRSLSGNQAKCGYGYPIFLKVDPTQPLYTIYQALAKHFDMPAEDLSLLQQFVHKTQASRQEYLKVLESNEQTKVQEPQPQVVVTQTKGGKTSVKKVEPPKPKTKDQLIAEFDAKVDQEFAETFGPLVRFKIVIRKKGYSKRVCNFCGKKCSGCVLPFSTHILISDFLARQPDENFELELVRAEAETIDFDKATPTYSLHTTVEDCLVEFTKPEQLDEQNPWYCDQCNDLRLAFKQLKIERYPKVLLLHLKRFKDVNGKKVKNNQSVAYPETLTVEDSEGSKQTLTYKLNSVIVHEGSLQGGHYWAICRKKGNKWFSFNDRAVKQEKQAFNKNAYILFYELMPNQKNGAH